MAAVRVQNYLKKHKIGALFESLMARVIQDMPEDPIQYIIKILEGIHKKQSKQLENSFSGLSPRPSSRNSTRSENKGKGKPSNHLAASWSAGVGKQQTRKDESQLRTWTGRDFQSAKNKTWSSVDHADQPAWNNDTRVPTHDFDELFQMQNGEENLAKGSHQETLEKYQGVRSWNTKEKQISVESKVSFQPDNSDELSRELQLGSRPSASPVTKGPATSITLGTRPVKTSKRAVEKHRKELQALLMEDSSAREHKKSGGKHSPEERGTEILERMEDLQNEGVQAAQQRTGAKLNKLKRDGNEDVSVTICARCARIIGDQDDNLSQAASSDFNSGMFDDLNRKNTGFDDIDSSSEASENMAFRGDNPWPMTDSENDTTPRNATVSFNKSFDVFPRKPSDSIFKSSNTEDDSPVQTQRSSRSRGSNFDYPNTARNGGWRLGDNDSDESENSDVMRKRSARSQVSGSMKGRAWKRNSGNISDEDSTLT